MNQETKCPLCAETIQAAAVKCKHCGEFLDGRQVPQTVIKTGPSSGVAAVLSFFLPGLGQLYQGRFLAGMFWFFIVAVGYVCLIVPGIFLHMLCVLSALITRETVQAHKLMPAKY